jgi:hypothetical protein
MTILGKSVLDIDKLLERKESSRENLEDTQYMKKHESIYSSYNSNRTNFDEHSQSSRRKNELTSITNNNLMNSSRNSNRNNIWQNEKNSNEELNSMDFRKSENKIKNYFQNVNQSCMNLKNKMKNPNFNETESSFRDSKPKKRLLTHSMIVSNYMGTPGKAWDPMRDSLTSTPQPKISMHSNKSMRFHRSSMKKSLDNSFQFSRKTLSPIQIPGDSFLKVNLSKIPSGTGRSN